MDITTKYKGESVTLDILLQDAEGATISDPALYAVYIVMSAQEDGPPISGAKYQALLEEPAIARYRCVLSPTNLDPLVEGRTYFYNVWSVKEAAAPEFRAKGRITLRKSIDLPA